MLEKTKNLLPVYAFIVFELSGKQFLWIIFML